MGIEKFYRMSIERHSKIIYILLSKIDSAMLKYIVLIKEKYCGLWNTIAYKYKGQRLKLIIEVNNSMFWNQDVFSHSKLGGDPR